jgi:hypothetical protein
MRGVIDLPGDVHVLAAYLARRDVESLDPAARRFDTLVLCGSTVLESVEVAARAFHDGVVGHLLVTGGRGHSTEFLERAVAAHESYDDVPTGGRAEAEVFAEILERHLDVPGDAITVEWESTNCGENAELSLRILGENADQSLLLVQDPTMQRRTHAGFDHHQRLLGTSMPVTSHAPFVPVVADTGVGPEGASTPTWSHERFLSLALGEVRRLRDDENGYGPRGAGYLDHVEIPTDVLAAYERLRAIVPPEVAAR